MIKHIQLKESSFEEYCSWVKEIEDTYGNVLNINHQWVKYVSDNEDQYYREKKSDNSFNNMFQYQIDQVMLDVKASENELTGNQIPIPDGRYKYVSSFRHQEIWHANVEQIYNTACSIDCAIMRACMSTQGALIRFGAIIQRGATDEELKKFLGEELGISGGGYGEEQAYDYKGGSNPRILITKAGKKDIGPVKLEGSTLVYTIRRIFCIPQYEGSQSGNVKQLTLF